MNQLINSNWGPALMVCFTIIIGILYNNSRITDMKESMNKRFEDLYRFLDAKFKPIEDDIRELKEYLKVKH